MGGINHQPCRTYLENSTLMSLYLSSAFASAHQANIGLEHRILAELKKEVCPSVHQLVLERLRFSVMEIGRLRESIETLSVQMDSENFEDLASLGTMNLTELGAQMLKQGLIQSVRSWTLVQGIMESVGFYGIIAEFNRRTHALDRLTNNLIEAIERCESSATRNGMGMSDVLEANAQHNFKAQFAQLFSAWSDFQDLFLASSLLSTEAWYRDTGVGSLVETNAAQVAA